MRKEHDSCEYNVDIGLDDTGKYHQTLSMNHDGIARFEVPDLSPFKAFQFFVSSKFRPFVCINGPNYQDCERPLGGAGGYVVVTYDLKRGPSSPGPQWLIVTAEATFRSGQVFLQSDDWYDVQATYYTDVPESGTCPWDPYSGK
jgi:hypothetical protein